MRYTTRAARDLTSVHALDGIADVVHLLSAQFLDGSVEVLGKLILGDVLSHSGVQLLDLCQERKLDHPPMHGALLRSQGQHRK